MTGSNEISPPKLPDELKSKKRAICLAGGGPAAGLHLGVLKGLEDTGLRFDKPEDVWALSCIGAWVGIVYNQATPGSEIEETINFFYDVFRNDASFRSFPANTAFTPDWAGNAEAMLDFLLEPSNYRNAFLPREILRSFRHTMSAIRRGSTIRRRTHKYRNEDWQEYEFKEFSEGDFNRWTLNDVLAVNPAVRFLTALLYKSKINGLSRLYYPDSSFLKQINFDKVREKAPFIYYNAWNLSQQKLVLFANRRMPTSVSEEESGVKIEGYDLINAANLCACSALPFILQTVTINGEVYCEGALIDTVNFINLLKDNPDLEEIWISRIVDAGQVLPPRNLHDSLANLCELFCATLGEDDVELFKYKVKYDTQWEDRREKLTIVEIPVDCTINFEWSHSNLRHGIESGQRAAYQAVNQYLAHKDDPHPGEPLIIGALTGAARVQQRKEQRTKRLKIARERLIEAGQVDY